MDFNNISIKGRLLGSNLVICFLLVALNVVVFQSISTMKKASEWVEHTEEVIANSKGLVNSMVNQETGLRGFAIAGQEDYLEPYIAGKADFKTYFQEAKSLTSDNPAQQVRFDEVVAQAKNWSEYAESIIQLRRNILKGENVNNQLTELIKSGVGKEKMDALRAEVDTRSFGMVGNIVINAMVNMETGLRGYILNREEQYLEPYYTALEVIKKQNQFIEGTVLSKHINGWINDYSEKAIPLVKKSNDYKTMADLYAELDKKKGKIYMDDLRSKISEIIDIEAGLMTQRKLESSNTATMANNVILFGSVIVVLLALIFAYFTATSITGPIQKAVVYAKQLAAGDLNINVGKQGTSEAGTLLLAIQTVSNNLKEMIGQIAETSNKLKESSNYLTSALEKTDNGAKEQLTRTEQISDAMQQLSIAVQEVSQNTVNAAHVATHADEEAQAGFNVIQSTIGHIAQLDKEIKQTSSQITDLAEETNNIGKILEVIGGIAEQTNLLALNAAIEAARAGEQGRGFAVVADEVRVLAKRTQESTTEIHTLIDRIQNGTNDVVASMEQSTNLLTSSINSASKSGSAFSVITGSITKINDMNTQSASASEEQSVATEQINESMQAVNSISHENHTTMMETVKSCEDLAKLSNELNSSVKQFKM
uniref:Methyl-accepting chemotaxis protein McpS n=1 Tax=Aliivibrio wodanis TaxID=80852 RepID=A0A5Q4YYQ9_9GAMM|nr:Methyl-accepting chemotaxis protein McpS [Aliivibrio wodanis]